MIKLTCIVKNNNFISTMGMSAPRLTWQTYASRIDVNVTTDFKMACHIIFDNLGLFFLNLWSLMLELFMGLKLELLKIILQFSFISSTGFFFQICDFKFLPN
jgi:hypothetical protein